MRLKLQPLILLASTFALASGQTSAHGLWQPDPGVALKTEIVGSYRNRGSSDINLWQVPGTLMGGEAEGSEQGFEVSDASITLSYFDEEKVYGIAELSQHAGHQEPEFEQSFVGLLHMYGNYQFQVDAGKFSAGFSPQNGRHAGEDHFVDVPLAYSVLYGGQVNDVGARFIASHPEGRGIGLELFEGDQFPASDTGASSSSNPRAADVFAYYHFVFDNFLLQARVWHNWFKAHQRPDTRLEADSGHSHAPLATDATPYWFDGDTHINGLRAKLIWLGWSWAQLRLTSEIFEADISGTVRDETRSAMLDSTLHAAWVKLALQKEIHTLAISYEQIKSDNTLRGDAGPALAELSGLVDMGRNPSRTRIAYIQQSRTNLGWSLELQRDHSSLRSFDAIVASLRWRGKWL